MIRLNPPTRLRLLPLVLAIGWGAGAQAQSLLDLYQSARGYDATYQSAKAQFDATLARADQAKALLLPKASLGLSSSRTNLESSSSSPPTDRVYGTQTATLSASQPLYRPADWAAYQQGIKGGEAAGAALKAAEQDLIVRLSQAYFDVLASSDSLQFVKAQKTAVQEQLASAKRNFEVGTATITDTREAQARFDLVLAQEIAADNDLRVKSLALVQLAGLPSAQPKSVAAPLALMDVTPNDVNTWVAQSQLENPALQQLQVNLDVAKLETSKAQAGHFPTLDLIGSYQATSNNGTSLSPTNNSGSNVTSLNLSLNIPVFAGFSTQNRVRETVSLEAKARTDLEGSQRTVAQATRAAFYGVQSGLGQVKALEAAEVSSQSALDANKLGYQVGVRINIDVLNSQSQLFDTKAKLAKARYDVLVGGLKLRQASGSLKMEDLEQVNALLAK